MFFKHRAVAFSMFFIAILSAPGCQREGSVPGKSKEISDKKTAGRIIRYYQNRSVAVPNEIERIACGWPAQNSIIAMLGYGDKIVATTDTIKSVPLFSKFVPSISKAVYCFSASDINIEALLKTRPDVLFIPDSSLRKFERIGNMGIAVVPFKSDSLRAIVDRTVITGEVLGPEAHKKALKYQEYFNHNVTRVQKVISTIPKEKRIRVYHSIRNLLSTAGSSSLVQDWMNVAGAVNVAETWFAGTKESSVSPELIISSDPDVILVMKASAADEIRRDKKWSNLRAVKNKKIYVNPKGMFWWCRETSEEALQILWLAKTLYPDHFADIDMKVETKHFYRTFYGYDLTESEVQAILYPT